MASCAAGVRREREKKAAVWPAGEAELAELPAARMAVLVDGADAVAARAALAELTARQADAVAAVDARHVEQRARRHAARAALGDDGDAAARHAIDQASRADTAERRRLIAAHGRDRADRRARA